MQIKSRSPRFPKEYYRRMYGSSYRSLPTLGQGLESWEDGDHYEPVRDFFEWWYFDAAFDNGYHLAITINSVSWAIWDGIPSILIDIFTPDSKEVNISDTFAKEDLKTSKERCDVRIGHNHARGEYPRYDIFYSGQGVEIELTFISEMKGWKAGTGVLFEDKTSNRHFNWVVPVPRARVLGRLCIGKETLRVEGIGYHDHNWGTIAPRDAFSKWYWGRMFADSYTIIYWDLTATEESDSVHVTALMLAREDKLMINTGEASVVPKNFDREERTGVCFPKRLEIEAIGSGHKARIVLNTSTITRAVGFVTISMQNSALRRIITPLFHKFKKSLFLKNTLKKIKMIPLLRKIAEKIHGGSFYFRFLADYEANITISGQTENLKGRALHEMMLLRQY